MTHEHGAETGIMCHHVALRERPMNYVQHNPDGSWDFMCGEWDGHDDVNDAKVVCAGCAFESYSDGLSADDVPRGSIADRPSKDKRWVIRPMTDEELSEMED